MSHLRYLPDWYVHIQAVFYYLLQVTLFWMISEIAAWINSVPRSIIYSILLANKEQEHGPLQTLHLSFAGAYSQMNTTLFQNRPGETQN